MKSVNVQKELTQVVADLLARNRFYFGTGGPDYYGVDVEQISSDGSEFDLTLTFKSGVRYCCVEQGCHIALYDSDENCAGWFKNVRDGLNAAGIENIPPMTVRKLHVSVEQGAISDGLRGNLHTHESRLDYECGPFHEVKATDEEARA